MQCLADEHVHVLSRRVQKTYLQCSNSFLLMFSMVLKLRKWILRLLYSWTCALQESPKIILTTLKLFSFDVFHGYKVEKINIEVIVFNVHVLSRRVQKTYLQCSNSFLLMFSMVLKLRKWILTLLYSWTFALQESSKTH